MWYRYFLAPPASGGARGQSAVSATLLVSALGGTLDDYARTYLAGNRQTASADERRPGAVGKSWRFESADGAKRYALLLLNDDPPAPAAGTRRVFGLYAQGEAAAFERERALLEAMAASLTPERPETYPEQRSDGFGFRLRVPESWRETRHFGGKDAMLLQFQSPTLHVDRGGATVHASLSLSVETLPADATLESFQADSRRRLGAAWQLQSHAAWGPGALDNLRAETSLSAARQRRYYRVAGGRGYTLACEARDDVFFRVARWCDLIGGTFRLAGDAPTTSAP